jgi:hypothetical protein
MATKGSRRARSGLVPSTLPGSFSSRVFIGGSYKAAASLASGLAPRQLLDELRKVVRAAGLHPVIADEYEVEERDRDIHHDAMFLLHACRLAIFELSEFSGALMEIERTADFDTTCIILHHDPKGKGHRLSWMLSSFVQQHNRRIRLYGYTDLDEAKNATRNWLDEMKRLGHAKAEK